MIIPRDYLELGEPPTSRFRPYRKGLSKNIFLHATQIDRSSFDIKDGEEAVLDDPVRLDGKATPSNAGATRTTKLGFIRKSFLLEQASAMIKAALAPIE